MTADVGGAPQGALAPITVHRAVPIPMRDGVHLLADVHTGPGPGRRPVLLQRTPYDRTVSLAVISAPGLEPRRAIDAGFAVVIQDVRGRFGSSGSFDPFRDEATDGEDTIAWIAEQDWCDGRVAMYGGSYVGATQLLAAGQQPPPLVGVAPWMTPSDYGEQWVFGDGVMRLGNMLRWIVRGLAPNELLRLREGAPDRAARLADVLARLAEDPDRAAHGGADAAAEALAELAPYLGRWLEHRDDRAYWDEISIRERFSRIAVPGLHLAGWYDLFLPGTLETFAGLRRHAATPEAREGQRLIVGPWSHAARGEAVGTRVFGDAAARDGLDPTRLQLEFFGACLRGTPPPGPPVRLFVMGADRWRDEDDWPLARAREQRWHLHAGGTLAPDPPDDRGAPSSFVHDPRDPVPTVAGATMLTGDDVSLVSGPRDRRAVQARDDVLSWTSAPLEHAVEITGPVSASLWVAAAAPEVDVVVTLSELTADGRAVHLVDGTVRPFPAGRAGDEVARIEVAMDATSVLVAAGTRLRVEVAGSCFPRFEVHPQQRAPVRQLVFHDPGRPSHLTLPLVGGRAGNAGA